MLTGEQSEVPNVFVSRIGRGGWQYSPHGITRATLARPQHRRRATSEAPCGARGAETRRRPVGFDSPRRNHASAAKRGLSTADERLASRRSAADFGGGAPGFTPGAPGGFLKPPSKPVDTTATSSNRLGDRGLVRDLHERALRVSADRGRGSSNAAAGDELAGDRAGIGSRRKDGEEGSSEVNDGSTCRLAAVMPLASRDGWKVPPAKSLPAASLDLQTERRRGP